MVPRLSNTKPKRASGDSRQLNGKQRGGTAARRPNTYHRSMIPADCRNRIREHRSYEGTRYFTVRIVSGKTETSGQKKNKRTVVCLFKREEVATSWIRSFEISDTCCSAWLRVCAVLSRPIDIPGETEDAYLPRKDTDAESRHAQRARKKKRTCRVRNRKRISPSDRSIVRPSGFSNDGRG